MTDIDILKMNAQNQGIETKYWTRDREAGNKIESFATLEEAKTAIESYENQDKSEGVYEEDFYEIYDSKNEEIVEL